MLCHLYVPSLRQHRTHLFRTWGRRRREKRERADQLRTEPYHHRRVTTARDGYREVAAACAAWIARHLRYSKGLVGVCGFKQDSRSHAASLWLPTKNIENNPMQSSRRSPVRTLGANT
jgi:hypothetical protein